MEDDRVFLKLRAFDATGATSDEGMNQLFAFVDYAEVLSVEPSKDIRGIHSNIQLRDGVSYVAVDNTPQEVMEEMVKASRISAQVKNKTLNG